MQVIFNELINVADLKFANIEDIEDKINLSQKAENYLNNQKWCTSIINCWYDKGWANKVAIFLFEIIPTNEYIDKFVWIIVGDIPSAYIDIESAVNGTCALKAYTEIMEDWINAVNNNKQLENCFPINVPPTKKFAKMLKIRIDLIKEEIIPYFIDELKSYNPE
jgi:hypothetical protein